MLVALLSTLIYLGNVLALFLFISGLSCPRYGLASLYLHKLSKNVVTLALKKNIDQVDYRDPVNLDRLASSFL